MSLPVKYLYKSWNCLTTKPVHAAEITVPILTLPKTSPKNIQHKITVIITIDESIHILTDENFLSAAIAIASIRPSPGRGAIFAGIIIKIPTAIKIMLNASIRNLPITERF